MAVIKQTRIYCNICGVEFHTEDYHGGSIEHDNETDDYNMDIFVNRFNSGEYSKFQMFLKSILLKGNYCNIKNYDYDTILEIFNCKIKWLMNNGDTDIANYLKSMGLHIKPICDFLREVTNEYSEIKAESMWCTFIEELELKEGNKI